jgi:hypothetical protein
MAVLSKGIKSVQQYFSKQLGRPVGPGESAVKLQDEVAKKVKGRKPKIKVIDERSEMKKAARRKQITLPNPTKRKKSKFEQKIDEDPQILGMAYGPMGVALVGADEYGDSVTRSIKSAKGKRDKTATFMKRSKKKQQKEEFLVGGQARIDANKDGKITGEDFKILRARNKKKKGGVTNAIKKIRGIGMAKGGFKKKTPIY